MQLHLDGSNSIGANRETAFRLLTDPNFLATTLPYAEDVHVLDGKSLEAKIKLKLAVISSTLRLKMTVGEEEAPVRAKLLAEGNGSGSSMKIVSTFTLAGDKPTIMKWAADAEITGVMAGLGSTILKGLATKKIAEIFDNITRAVEMNSG